MTRVSQVGQNLLITAGDVFANCQRMKDGTYHVDVTLNLFPGRGYMGEAGVNFRAVVDDFGNIHKVGV